MDRDTSFGRRLHRLRKERDLTQEALAQQAYCAVDTIKKIEAGIRRPSRQLAAQFADCLGLTGEERAAFIAAARAGVPGAAATPAGTAAPIGGALAPAAPPHRSNLPAQPTALLGRASEVAAVCALLRHADVRLLTLTGPGGVGKTRLALQAAAETLGDFASGAAFVALTSISDPDLVFSTIAQTLGVREAGGQPLIETLIAALQGRQMLLLLDNFEQVVAAAPCVADLLAGCPQLKVLITSRVPLHLRGEKEIPVPPLALPDLQRLPALDHLTQYAAVELFLQRARDVQPTLVLTKENAPAVAGICSRLDGLPLAIELAATRSKLLPPQALLARLDHRLTLLTGGARDLALHQQTIRATIDWSYDLLDEDERRLFRRLAVFVGGCTLEAAATVCNAEGDLTIDVLDGIAALLDQSLLQQVMGEGDEPRFMMLETLHEYALERLAEHGEEGTTRQRHAAYFLALAEQADPEMRGAQQKEWLDRLELEHNNLRAALAWGRSAPDGVELSVRLSGALGWFWFMHGNFSEARAWLEGALEQGMRAVSSSTASARARVLHLAGVFAQFQDDFARATMLIEASLALYREAGNHTLLAEALVDLGRTAYFQGDHERAAQLEEQGLVLYREQGNALGIAFSLLSLGDAALGQSNTALATARYQEALALFRGLGARDDIAWTLWGLGRVAYTEGEYRQASALLEESLALFRDLGNRQGTAGVLSSLGQATRVQGDCRRAAMYFAESLVLSARILGKKSHSADCLRGLAGVAGAEGQPAHAARLFGAAEALRESAGVQLPPVDRAAYERDVAGVRAQLDDATFAAAWDAGRALTLEQAITYALDLNI